MRPSHSDRAESGRATCSAWIMGYATVDMSIPRNASPGSMLGAEGMAWKFHHPTGMTWPVMACLIIPGPVISRSLCHPPTWMRPATKSTQEVMVIRIIWAVPVIMAAEMPPRMV